MLVRLAHLLVVILFLLCLNAPARAQDARYFKREIAALCNPMMAGRGYVRKGRDRAVLHIVHRFRDYGVAPAGPDSSYIQPYAFPVNTFPDSVLLSLNGKPLAPGADFIIDAASPSFNARKIKITTVDFTKGIDSAGWLKWQEKFTRTTNRAWYFKGVDSLYKALAIRPSKLAALLPKGAYIIPQHGKMNWDVATETIPATVFYAEDSVLPRQAEKGRHRGVHSVLVPAFKNGNIMGKVARHGSARQLSRIHRALRSPGRDGRRCGFPRRVGQCERHGYDAVSRRSITRRTRSGIVSCSSHSAARRPGCLARDIMWRTQPCRFRQSAF